MTNVVPIQTLLSRYCYECINKATGAHHCLVCGHQDSKPGLIHCSSCPRAYHTSCIQPSMAKVSKLHVTTWRDGWRTSHQFHLSFALSEAKYCLYLKILCPNGIFKKVSMLI